MSAAGQFYNELNDEWKKFSENILVKCPQCQDAMPYWLALCKHGTCLGCDIDNFSNPEITTYPFDKVKPRVFTENDLHEYVRLQKRPLRRQLRAQKATIKALMNTFAYRRAGLTV
jgi:hypothetical protein